MITKYMRETIKEYKDALGYVIEAYQAKGLKRNTFTVALKDMYELMREKEKELDKAAARRRRWSLSRKVGRAVDV